MDARCPLPLVALLFAGCTSYYDHYRYSFPSVASAQPEEEPRGLVCYQQCVATEKHESYEFFRCLRACPGVEIVVGNSCEGAPESTVCHVQRVRRIGVNQNAIGTVAVGVAVIGVGASAAAVTEKARPSRGRRHRR